LRDAVSSPPSSASSHDTYVDGSASTKQSKGSPTAGADFERLAALWPKLSPADRAALLTLAASLGTTERGR